MAKHKRKAEDYLYYLLVGSLYLFAVNKSIIVSTIIAVPDLTLYLTGLTVLIIFLGVFFNWKTLLTCLAFGVLAGLYLFITYESHNEDFAFINELLLLIRGYLAYRDEYAAVLVRLICVGTGLLTALFMYARFNFYVLAFSGVSTFAVNWIMNYRRDDGAFILFLFCFCLLLVRKLNRNLNRGGREALTALLALPVCVLAVFFAGRIPGEDAAYVSQPISELFNKPLSAVSEFFYLAFNPKYFSFQTTGFTRANNQLGGPVAANAREVMQVEAPGRLYLSGATKNVYTGSSWEDSLADGDINTGGLDPGTFEFLETAAAMMRGTSFYNIPPENAIWRFFPMEDQARIDAQSFPYLGVFTPRSTRLSYLYELLGGSGDVTEATVTIEDAKYDLYDLQNARRINLGLLFSYLPVGELQVYVGSNRLGTVFRPAKGRTLTFSGEGQDYSQELRTAASGDFSTQNLMEKGTAYGYQYLNIDRRLRFVNAILDTARRGYYAEAAENSGPDYNAVMFDELYRAYTYNSNTNTFTIMPGQRFENDGYGINAFTSAVDSFSLDVLDGYAGEVYAHHMELPDTLPQRVYDLAAELVKDCETDYERVKALEAYLITFPYTLEPSAVPEGADFVDYFLFEGKEGYCTYYASAMAVLSRCAGIPSRYAEGYITPPDAGEENGNKNLYTITNKQAHSWAEVYLEGYGWLAVEATAPYHYVADSEKNETSSVTAGMFSSSFMESDSYEEHLRDMGFNEEMIQAPGFVPAAAGDEASNPLNLLIVALHTSVSLASVTALFFMFILVQRIREYLRLRQIARMPVNAQAQVYFNGIIKMTSYYHYPLHKGETPRNYGARLGKRFAFKSDKIFLRDLITLYYKARYGTQLVSDEELALLRDCYADMAAFLRRVRLLPRYVFLRYIRRVMLP